MKKVISAVGIAAASLFAINAQAADGTITFTGSITDTTCSINGVAAGTPADVTVTLPAVPASSLANAGDTAGVSGPSDIVFSLSGCTGGATKAIARFENGPTVDQSSGNLVNQASTGGASNVQVQLLNSNFQPINITTNSNNDIATLGAAITAGNADLTYYGQYFSTGAATAGAVDTSVQYTMDYQ
ncbi:fimbrial protein [Variovorax sp.]|uniref:fimbrial protein n=1 Tax=Variovorax sp. TaxID=1871043 RepID=UPI002D68EBD0|nr:fimbrial protein [Variovorax sp.]HYP86188.1 fimbrial protein [Variovorax sp.]